MTALKNSITGSREAATYRDVLELLHVRYKVVADASHSSRQRHSADEGNEHQDVGEESREVHHLPRKESSCAGNRN